MVSFMYIRVRPNGEAMLQANLLLLMLVAFARVASMPTSPDQMQSDSCLLTVTVCPWL
jgi:hypothetical protein